MLLVSLSYTSCVRVSLIIMDQIRQQRFIYNYFFGSLHCRFYFKKIFYISLLFILFCNADWFYLHLCRYEERCIMWARSQEFQNLHKWQYEHCTQKLYSPPSWPSTWSATQRDQQPHVVRLWPRGQMIFIALLTPVNFFSFKRRHFVILK